jgi:AcrR family transcriptional regulator
MAIRSAEQSTGTAHPAPVEQAPPTGPAGHPGSAASGRAAPLAPAERRATIVAATLPLLRIHGNAVTTKQIAEASGIGEGTIFRVFADKAALIDATLEAAFDPAPVLAELSAIDPAQSLESRLLAAIGILQRRLHSVLELMMALGLTAPPGGERRRLTPNTTVRDSQVAIVNALEQLIEPDRWRLRICPGRVARAVRLLTFAGTHPGITDEQPMSSEEIVAVLLHGILNRPEPGC